MKEKNETLDELKEYREKLASLTEEEKKQRDLYLKRIAEGTIQGPQTGFASIDKQWLKYYEDEAILSNLPKKSAYEYMKSNNKNNMKNDAINFFGLKMSYKKLIDKIEQTARSLTEMGVKQGDYVVINSVTLPQTVYLMYALNKIGAIANFTDLRTDANGMKHYLNEGKSKFVFLFDSSLKNVDSILKDTSIEQIVLINPMDEVPTIAKKITNLQEQKKMSDEEKKNIKEEKDYIAKYLNTHDNTIGWNEFYKRGTKKTKIIEKPYEENYPTAIVHTSGTTSLPKSVVLTNENFNAMALQYGVSDFKYSGHDSLLNIIPIFTAYGAVNSLHMPLCLGMTDIVYPKVVNSDFTEIIRKFKPNHVIAIPMHWEFLLSDKNMDGFDMSFLKTAACGGDKLNIELEKKLNIFLESHNSKSKIVKGYGMTEVAACAVTNTNNTSEIGSVGIPLVKNNIKIIDPDSKMEVLTGNQGEICISSPSAMKEYYNNEKETDETVKIHDDGIRWIHSGDLGHLSTDGKLEIDGRIKRLIIRRGFKVSAIAIENAIMQNQAVENCVVVKVPDKEDGEVPYAFVVLKEEYRKQELDIFEEIKYSCEKSLPNYYFPEKYLNLQSIPYTKNNKVDVLKLEKQALEIKIKETNDNIKVR